VGSGLAAYLLVLAQAMVGCATGGGQWGVALNATAQLAAKGPRLDSLPGSVLISCLILRFFRSWR